MGIKGIYQEIGPGKRIALSKLAVETLETRGRPLRLAIDISIWLFQIQSGKGGTNPALRTFYYRLLRLITLSIHPLFVFDGPNKPPFKRNKRTGPNVASIPEFLAKQLLKQFGLPFHLAPGEAEAECASLQQHGIVDAVLSEDVDTLMFGSGLTLRNWSAEGPLKGKTATHVNLYDAQITKAGSSGLDREGMILVALMSGGDYIPEGIPGCGPKTACEAARAGFGLELCKLSKRNRTGIAAWKERLCHELKTNESKYFRQKHKALVVPDDFPRFDILGYYTTPVISPAAKVEQLRQSICWDREIDFQALRTFAGEAFDWVCLSGAKKFIRNLAPALLVKSLRLRASEETPDDPYEEAQKETNLISTVYTRRQHPTTDNTPEIRVGFVPINLVPLDLECEEPDPEEPIVEVDSDDEAVAGIDIETELGTAPASPRKRGPSTYDPTQMERLWILETYLRLGVPLKMQDWDESLRDAKKYEASKALRKRAEKGNKKKATDMPRGALNPYVRVTKPNDNASGAVPTSRNLDFDKPSEVQAVTMQASGIAVPPGYQPSKTPRSNTSQETGCENHMRTEKRPTFQAPRSLSEAFLSPAPIAHPAVVDLVSSPSEPASANTSRDRALRRSESLPTEPVRVSENSAIHVEAASALQASKRDLRVENDTEDPFMDFLPTLPSTITTRRKRSPLRRAKTTPSFGENDGLRTPPAKRLNMLQQPNLLSTGEMQENPATTHFGSEAVAKEPCTPKSGRSRPGAPKNAQVITISSSPTPASGRSIQSPITAWLTSTNPREPPSPSPVRTKAVQRSELASAPEWGAESGVSLQTANAPSSRGTFIAPAAPKRKVLRLRDSLAGGFAVEEGSSPPAKGVSGMAAEGQGQAGQRWRLSEVQALDLTHA